MKGLKHKPAERTAIYEPKTQNLLTDESKILKTTLNYNIGVLTKIKVQPQDLDAAKKDQDLHKKRFEEPQKRETYRDVIGYLGNRNKNVMAY